MKNLFSNTKNKLKAQLEKGKSKFSELLIAAIVGVIFSSLIFGLTYCNPKTAGCIRREKEDANEATYLVDKTLKGIVYRDNAVTEQPVYGCRVAVSGSHYFTSTDTLGRFTLEFEIHEDSLFAVLLFTAEGYQEEEKKVAVPTGDTTLNFESYHVLTPESMRPFLDETIDNQGI